MKILPAKQYPKGKRKIQKREKRQTEEQYTSEEQFSCSSYESDEWEPVKDDICIILKSPGKPILKQKVNLV